MVLTLYIFNFLPAVIFLHFAIPYKWRWLLLLFVSYYFYMCWKAEYAFLIVLSTSIDYLCGLQMSKHEDKKKRKPWMILSIVMNLSILFLFKYFNFFNDSARVVFDSLNIFYNVPEFKLLLPVGLSFIHFRQSVIPWMFIRAQQKQKRISVFCNICCLLAAIGGRANST